MKSEPSEFSIDDLAKVHTEPWDGVRNYQVRNMFRDDFSVGDAALFYHSNATEIGIVGVMKVASNAYPDPTQFDPKNSHYDPKAKKENPPWLLVDVQFVEKLPSIVSLTTLKNDSAFADVPIIKKGNRLSIVEITKCHYDRICKLGYAQK